MKSNNAYYEATIKDGYKKGSNRTLECIAPSKKVAMWYFESLGEVMNFKKLSKPYHGSQATR